MKLLFPIGLDHAKPFLFGMALGWAVLGIPLAVASGGGGGPTPFVKLEPAIVANLASGGKYIKADIQVHVEDLTQSPEVKLHAPALRHELLLLFTEQNGTEIRSPEGREKLKKQALEITNNTLKKILHTRKELISDLYFTSFMVQ